MSIVGRLWKTYVQQHGGRCLINIGKTQHQFYTTNITTHHSFLYEPPKNGQETSDSLKQVAPKVVLPLLQATYQDNTKEIWKLYLELCDKKQLNLLSPLQHSRVLKAFSFDKNLDEEQRCNLGKQLSFIFNKMKSIGVEPDVNDFTHMMNTFSLIGNSKVCDNLWEEMIERKIQPNTYTYNSYMTSCLRLIRSSKNRREEGLWKAQKILNSLKNSDKKSNIVTNCLFARLFLESNDLGNAQNVVEITFSRGDLSKEENQEILQNQSIIIHTFNYLMNAYGNAGNLLMMDKCFQLYLNTKLQPHIYMFNTLVRNSSKTDIDKAKEYIKVMIQEFDLKPTHQIFSYILFNLYDKGLTKKAVEFVKVMEDEFKFPPSELMLVKIYKTMLRKKRYKEAKEFAHKYNIF